jgi:signal peptidase I
MIYDNSYFSKELRQGYIENKISTGRKITFALFTGLISFALYFIFQTMKESIFYETFPEVMQTSFFSTVYIYIHVALIINTVYFIFLYDSLFFHEIKRNSWYLLVKNGYNPLVMIIFKVLAMLFSVIFTYTIGFFTTIFLTLFLRYSVVFSYFPALYLAGLIDLIAITIISMTISTFINKISNARYTILFSLVALLILKIKLGYYKILTNRVSMQNIFNLFNLNKSLYVLVLGVIISIYTLICILKARNISKYYCLVYNNYDYDISGNARVVLVDNKTKKIKPIDNKEKRVRQKKVIDAVVYAFLILNLLVVLSFNVIILLINATTSGKTVSIFGFIPYVFKSNTMEPGIMVNDLVYFKKFESDYVINKGEIILFEENNIIYIERIVDIDKEVLKVDIDNYPPMSEPNAMIKYVEPGSIYGIYSGRSRWLGAFILFANTIIGRLALLLIPGVLLYYHKPITDKLFQADEE